MKADHEIMMLFGITLLIISVLLYVQEQAGEFSLKEWLWQRWYRIGLRRPYKETEKWWNWDYLWGHVAWCLGVREILFFWQRRTRGFDNSALWSLDWTIIHFTLPRLKAFRNLRNGESPMGFPIGILEDFGLIGDDDAAYAKWLEVIDKMIAAMQLYVDEYGYPHEDAKIKQFEEGMDLFYIYLHSLGLRRQYDVFIL